MGGRACKRTDDRWYINQADCRWQAVKVSCIKCGESEPKLVFGGDSLFKFMTARQGPSTADRECRLLWVWVCVCSWPRLWAAADGHWWIVIVAKDDKCGRTHSRMMTVTIRRKTVERWRCLEDCIKQPWHVSNVQCGALVGAIWFFGCWQVEYRQKQG